jgi:hypothetical protein
VGDGPRSQQLAFHTLRLPPGRHVLTLGCDRWCEEVRRSIDVPAEGPARFNFSPRLKPARVSFDVQPADAKVTVGASSRSARDSLTLPFDIRSDDKLALKSLLHEVTYEVAAEGYQTSRPVVQVRPGEHLVVKAALRRQP